MILQTRQVYKLKDLALSRDDSNDNSDFEQAYLAVRGKEGRLLTDEQVFQLPNTQADNPHHKEWLIRQHSSEKVRNYLNHRNTRGLGWVLDIGCGNGWFSHLLAKAVDTDVLAIDINVTELEQAKRVFNRENLHFACLDLLRCPPNPRLFSLIFINSSFQYFSQPRQLLDLCLTLLTDGGEIHLLDSPFYPQDQVLAAKQRSADYYQQLGIAPMNPFYHHHSLTLLDDYSVEWLYRPPEKSARTAIDSPFPWLKITK